MNILRCQNYNDNFIGLITNQGVIKGQNEQGLIITSEGEYEEVTFEDGYRFESSGFEQ